MFRRALYVLLACSLGLAACDATDPLTPDAYRVPLADLLTDTLAVTLNPYEAAPLTAEATFTTKGPASVMVEVLGAEPLRHRFPEPATEHAVPILGLYPGTTNRVVLRVSSTGITYAVDTLAITTAPLPDFLPTVAVETVDPGRMEAGWTLSSLGIGGEGRFRSYPIIFDNNGDIRWYLDLSFLSDLGWPVERLANGNLLFGFGAAVFEYDMLGREVNRWDIPGYWAHHDVIEKPDGNLLVAVDKTGIGTIEDHVIEIDRATGAVVNEWDLRQILDVHRRDHSTNEQDWFHMNAIWYSEADDALILSGQAQSAVVKVTRDNELVWILAPHQGWGKAGPNADGHDTSDFLLTAVDGSGEPYPAGVQQGTEAAPGFQWAWGQHAPLLLPDGNLFLFDNGLNRNYANAGPFSRGVEYVIDEAQGTVRQVWAYGEARGNDFFSPIISDVDVLPGTGNRLIMPGIIFGPPPRAMVTEVTYPGQEVVFEAEIQFKNQLSSGSFAWGEFDLVYRSERLPIYPR
jgi:arylsulfate sulfotransferase